MLDEKHGRIPQIQQYIYDLFENAIFPMEQIMKSNNDTIRAEVFHKDIFPNCDCFFTHCNTIFLKTDLAMTTVCSFTAATMFPLVSILYHLPFNITLV